MEGWRVYDGDWVNGQIEGRGIFRYADGTEYDGAYRAGKRQRRWRDARGDRYSYNGGWFEDLENGYGNAGYSDGSRYSGTFVRGKYEGLGTFTAADGTVTEGIWSGGSITPAPHVRAS